jgi:two-component system phosphate regulon response regulator PhoB
MTATMPLPKTPSRESHSRESGASMNPALKPLVLIVEDEADLVTLLRYNLEKDGFRTVVAGDGEEALLLASERVPNLILLDWMLPLMSGLEVCRQLRRGAKTRDIPIIMVTARGEEADRVRGLNSGADDYITKPFSPTELTARMRAVLRRAAPGTSDELLQFGDVVMDLAGHRVRRQGRDVHLGPTEFRLLRHFMQHPGRVFSREQLLDIVWGHDVYVEPRTVDVHIRRLRKALNGDTDVDVIRTVRSAGYALDSRAD